MVEFARHRYTFPLYPPAPHLQYYMKNTKCHRHRLRVSNAGELKGRLAPEAALQLIPPGFIHNRTKTDSMSHNPKLPSHAHFTCLTDPIPNQAHKRVACPWGCPTSWLVLLFLLLDMLSLVLDMLSLVLNCYCCCSACYCWCSTAS